MKQGVGTLVLPNDERYVLCIHREIMERLENSAPNLRNGTSSVDAVGWVMLLKFADARYEGGFTADKFHGQGTWCGDNGQDTYTGGWFRNKKDGAGVLTSTVNGKYDGEWSKNNKQGNGKWTSIMGDNYNGQWELDMKHGDGEFVTTRGEKYSGQWRKDKRHEHGVWTGIHNDSYDGQWLDDFMHGQGKLILDGGEVTHGCMEV